MVDAQVECVQRNVVERDDHAKVDEEERDIEQEEVPVDKLLSDAGSNAGKLVAMSIASPNISLLYQKARGQEGGKHAEGENTVDSGK